MSDQKTSEQIKAELEIKKLEAEIRNVNLWWRAPLLQVVPTLILIVTSLAIAYGTGLLDAKKEHVAAQTLKLEISKEKTEGQIVKLNETVKKLNEAVRSSKAKNIIHEQVEWLGESSFSKKRDNTYSFRLTPSNSPDEKRAVELLTLLEGVERVSEVSIIGYKLGKPEFDLLAKHDLATLELVANELTDDLFNEISKFSNLKSLYLGHQKITSLKAISSLKQLKALVLSDLQLTDDSLMELSDLSDRLQVLYVAKIPLTDKVAPFLRDRKSLTDLRIGNVALTDAGLGVVLENRRIKLKVFVGQYLAFADQHPDRVTFFDPRYGVNFNW